MGLCVSGCTSTDSIVRLKHAVSEKIPYIPEFILLQESLALVEFMVRLFTVLLLELVFSVLFDFFLQHEDECVSTLLAEKNKRITHGYM